MHDTGGHNWQDIFSNVKATKGGVCVCVKGTLQEPGRIKLETTQRVELNKQTWERTNIP